MGWSGQQAKYGFDILNLWFIFLLRIYTRKRFSQPNHYDHYWVGDVDGKQQLQKG